MMKGWQNRGVIGQVSPKSSWEQTNYEEREGKNAYKKRRSAIEEGIQKNLERKLREERERERERKQY